MVRTGPYEVKRGSSERARSAAGNPNPRRRKSLRLNQGGARTMAVRGNSDGDEDSASGSVTSKVNPTGSNESGSVASRRKPVVARSREGSVRDGEGDGGDDVSAADASSDSSVSGVSDEKDSDGRVIAKKAGVSSSAGPSQRKRQTGRKPGKFAAVGLTAQESVRSAREYRSKRKGVLADEPFPFAPGTVKYTGRLQKKGVQTGDKGRKFDERVTISGSGTDNCVSSRSVASEIGPGSLDGDKKKRKKARKKRKIAVNKIKNAAAKEDLEASEKLVLEKEELERSALSYSHTSYGKQQMHDLFVVFDEDKLTEFLLTESVSGGCKKFKLADLVLIDDARIVCCWVSPMGKTNAERLMIGIRMVSYFHPMRAVVLNLTVIFEDHRGQRHLDPMNKVRILFCMFSFTYQSTFFLYILLLDEGNNELRHRKLSSCQVCDVGDLRGVQPRQLCQLLETWDACPCPGWHQLHKDPND